MNRRPTAVAVMAGMLGSILALAPLSPLPSQRVEAAVPTGFTQTNVASAVEPTGIEALPDGRIVVLQQGGQVRLLVNGVLLPAVALDLAVCSGSEQGLLGFVSDPQFAVNHLVYLYYTDPKASAPGGCVNRVSRFSMVANVIDPASEVVLIDGISSASGNHNGGDLAFGADGFLYVSVGDAGGDPRGDSGSSGNNNAAQDLSLLNGKILRVNPATGEAAPGNPLIGGGGVACRTRGNTSSTPTTACAELYAWGLRNPWRIAFDPNPGPQRFFINDVGQGTREEVDLGAMGANYGWNISEGQCLQGQNPPCSGPAAGLTDPITDYPHTGSRSFITGGAFVPNGVWPAAFDGGYLFADGGSGEIWLRKADGSVDYASPFATGAQGLADMVFVPEGGGLSLYYTIARSTSNSVRKISFASAPAAPSGPLAFVAAPPGTRLLDTRLPAAGGAPIPAGTNRLVPTGFDGAVTRAVLVSIADVLPVADGFITAWAGPSPRPTTANVNARAGETVSNMAIVPVDATGGFTLFSFSTAHVVVDLLGRFDSVPGAVSAGRFQAVSPSRLADTRTAATAANVYTRVAGSPYPRVNVPIAGRGGLPASGIASVVLVVTALAGDISTGGFLTATAGGAAWPGTANVTTNGADDVRPNTVVVSLGRDGSIDLHLFAVHDVVVDVAGWFTDSSAPPATAGRFISLPPTREVDTRIGQGFARLSAFGTRVLDPLSVPPTAAALAHNIAIVDNSAPGFITPYPGGPLPLVAAGNVTAPGQVRSILTFTQLSPTATMSYYSFMDTDLVVDVTGYFEG